MQFWSKYLHPQFQLIGWFRHLVSLSCDNYQESESIPFVDSDTLAQNDNFDCSQNEITNDNHYARNSPNLHNVDQVEFQRNPQLTRINQQQLNQQHLNQLENVGNI